MSSNYPPGITGMEPEIIGSGQLDYAYGMEKEYMTNYLAKVKVTIAGLVARIAQLESESLAPDTEQLERVLENNYVIKDGLEMSLQDIAWQEANL